MTTSHNKLDYKKMMGAVSIERRVKNLLRKNGLTVSRSHWTQYAGGAQSRLHRLDVYVRNYPVRMYFTGQELMEYLDDNRDDTDSRLHQVISTLHDNELWSVGGPADSRGSGLAH